MTLLQAGIAAFIMLAIVAAWARHSLERTLWGRGAELYLWLLPMSLPALAFVHRTLGLRGLAGVGTLHLVIAVTAWRSLAGRPAERTGSGPPAVAGLLLLLGAGLVWIGAASFPGSSLAAAHERRAEYVFTAALFLVGAAVALAGFSMVSSALRAEGQAGLADLGLVALLAGFGFWGVHLAFRVTVTVAAARTVAEGGPVPVWFEPWRAWAGAMYGLYMVTGYLAPAAYGAAAQRAAWIGARPARVIVVFSLLAACGFVARVPIFNPPLLVQVVPFVLAMLLLRRRARVRRGSDAAATARLEARLPA